MAVKIRKEVQRINKTFHTTILLTSHYMQEVEQLANRIAFVYGGRIIDTGNIKKIRMLGNDYNIEIKADKIKHKEKLRNYGFKIKGNMLYKKLESDEELNELLVMLSKLGINVKDIEIKKPSLEDYFIKIVGENREMA